jgi:two-component system NtrC family sensor kinase
MPTNEAARLKELRSFGILDSLPDQAYDDIVQLAAFICETPIALVSLVDEHRQWFKAKRGLSASETPRELAFCAHALDHPDEFFIVPDTLADPRFASHALVTSAPFIRFYAGAPLVTSQKNVLGTLCVIDCVPRRLNSAQKVALHALSRQVVALIEAGRPASSTPAGLPECRSGQHLDNQSLLTLEPQRDPCLRR